MHTSLLTLTLMVAPMVAPVDGPVWLQSYSGGMEIGQKQGRPVAVFVGSGPQGQAVLVKEGQFSDDTLHLLRENYVCVYLDRSQPSNQRLVRDLSIGLAGVVISDRAGTLQAFHHDGAISQADLNKRLRQFGHPDLLISTTVSNAAPARVSYYSDPGAPVYQPVSFSPQYFAPSSRSANC